MSSHGAISKVCFNRVSNRKQIHYELKPERRIELRTFSAHRDKETRSAYQILGIQSWTWEASTAAFCDDSEHISKQLAPQWPRAHRLCNSCSNNFAALWAMWIALEGPLILTSQLRHRCHLKLHFVHGSVEVANQVEQLGTSILFYQSSWPDLQDHQGCQRQGARGRWLGPVPRSPGLPGPWSQLLRSLVQQWFYLYWVVGSFRCWFCEFGLKCRAPEILQRPAPQPWALLLAPLPTLRITGITGFTASLQQHRDIEATPLKSDTKSNWANFNSITRDCESTSSVSQRFTRPMADLIAWAYCALLYAFKKLRAF